MKRQYSYITLLAILALLPQVVFALDGPGGYEFSWTPASNDMSIKYLGQIFGTMSTALAGTGNALIGNLFTIFNIAVLTLGGIIVSYTIVMGTMHTAQEGEVMGKRWSSMWIPLRSSIGMAFLLPTASGYSLLQILMMNVIVYGIAAADNIWGQIVYTMAGQGTGVTGTITVPQGDLFSATSGLLKSMVCANTLNTNTACQNDLSNASATAYSMPDPQNASSVILAVGVPGNYSLATVCGGLRPGSQPSQVSNQTSWVEGNITSFQAAASSLLSTANDIVRRTTSLSADPGSAIAAAMNMIQGGITSTPSNTSQVTLDEAMSSALQNGWLFAGSYYFVMISNGNQNLTYPAPTAVSMSAPTNTNLKDACKAAINTNLALAATYTSQAQSSQNLASSSLNLPTNSSSPEVSQFMDAIAGPLRGAVENFMTYLTTNDPRGPLASLAAVGSNILNVAQDIWFAVIIAGLILMLAGCTMSGLQPFCFAIGAIIGVLCTVLNFIIGLLWGVGAMLGLYMPLIPYIVFTFTSLGWFLLVIETIVAAPIVALGLVSPAGEHLGKATPALTLIANVFLRPSLMLIGLIAATYLTNAVIGLLNYGFQATVASSVSGLGIFGLIALLILYGSLVIALIHESFSLIHVLPDKIIRWIGGQAEKSSVKEHLEAAKKSVDKGAEMGAEAMKGTASMVQEKGEASVKKGFSPASGGNPMEGGGG